MNNSLGRLMIVGFDGTKAPEDLLSLIRDEGIGGVILFKRNYASFKQLKRLVSDLKEAAGGKLIVSIDHEGGRVMRLKEPFTHFPAAARVAEKGKEAVFDAGRQMGEELSRVGINLNFAPVLDVATNAFNTVIGDRSYGPDPLTVAEFGVLMMKGLMEGGVVPCGKHFPGHGDTDLDSHLSLPVSSLTPKRLDVCELHPFRVAIAAGIPMLMTAHLLVPCLDPKWPASVSKRIAHDLLRKEMRFPGVIITDDLRMKGISNLMPIPQAACRSLAAGHDMVMICRDIGLARETLEAIKRAVDEGMIKDIEGRFKRISRLGI